MHFFKCDDLQAWTGGKWHALNAAAKPDIRGFSIDSRRMEKDFAFVALKAARDGHDFAADAVANGATAIMAERELDVGAPVLVVPDARKALRRIAKMHRLRFEWPVIGISGSCGKTSTREMLAKLLSWKNPLVTKDNLNNELGVPLTLLGIDTRQNQLAIVEAGVAAPGQMEELAEMIEPDVAIITNVGLNHMEGFAEVGNVAKEKAKLAANAAAYGWALFHHNLLSWKAFSELKCRKAVVVPADAPDVKADLVFRHSFVDNGETVGIDMSIEGGAEYFFEIRKMSDGMLDNALLAIAAALMLGTKEEQIAAKLEEIAPLPMRGSIVERDGKKFYIDCYNASPTSMKDALAFFSEASEGSGPKMYVMGGMAELGLGTHRHHKEIGYNLPHSEGDVAVLVGPNAEIYKTGMLESQNWREEDIRVFQSAAEAKQAVSDFAGGAVFVKGSRVCELEKALPDDILEALRNPARKPAETPCDGSSKSGGKGGGSPREKREGSEGERNGVDEGAEDGESGGGESENGENSDGEYGDEYAGEYEGQSEIEDENSDGAEDGEYGDSDGNGDGDEDERF